MGAADLFTMDGAFSVADSVADSCTWTEWIALGFSVPPNCLAAASSRLKL